MTNFNAVNLSQKPITTGFFDKETNTVSYVVQDPESSSCAIIDSVLDIDYAAGRLDYRQAEEIITFVQEQKLELQWIIETHVHADHLSAAPYIQDKIGGYIGIGEGIREIQETFGKVFNEGTEFQRDGSQFDRLFANGDTYQIGNLSGFVMHTPGHTPACNTHVIGDSAFVGDTLFMPDGGSARADFPGGDAGQLFDSIQTILSLPDELKLFMCHDYGPGGREICWETTVKEQREHNVHLANGTTREAFIDLRTKRDATLAMPKLIIPSLQVNMRAGELPTDDKGNPQLKVPLNGL